MITLPQGSLITLPQDADRSLAMTSVRIVSTLLLSLCAAVTLPAQSELPAVSLPSRSLKINVVVDTKSGQPVTDLHQQDFTLLDNKEPRPITSFRIMSAGAEPVHVILFLDAVNTPYQTYAYMREGVAKFLKAKEGSLANPTAIAILTDSGAQIVNDFSTNGNALSDVLEHHMVGLREITRSSEWGGIERMQICLNAFHQLVQFASTLPGHKLVLWVSPGWPLVSGPRVYLSTKQEQGIFGDVVSFSTQLRQNDMTLYNINPFGVDESLERADYYEAFLKGVARPNDVQLGDLGIQVLATHSGGLVIESNSDVYGMIQRCLADAQSWYEITFDPTPADKPNEYHHVEIKLPRRDLVARTLDGYYANVQMIEPGR